jgi:hypothetical protein
MASGPSIKGIVLQLAMEPLQRLLDQGRLKQADLEARLSKQELQLLEDKVVPGLWYPVASVGRVFELVLQVEHPGAGPDAAVQAGAAAAQKLAESQVFKSYITTAGSWGPRGAGPALVRMAEVLFNFMRFRFDGGKAEADGFRIEVEDAAALPDVLRFLVQGGIQHLSERVSGRPVRVSSERPAPDRILYTGTR